MRHRARPHCQIPARFFFFEKKKQKTFPLFGARWLTTARLTKQKVFLLLFLQKKKISSGSVIRNTMCDQVFASR
jgi:hypothetical protein